MNTYEKLLKIKNSTRYDYFSLACSYFFDIGYKAAKKITDEDIKKVKANGIMTKDFCEWMMETAREIANTIDSAVELVQFCEVENIFEIRQYANKLSRDRLEEMVCEYINNNFDVCKKDDLSEIVNNLDCDLEELEMLGYELPEGWEDWEM